MATTRGENGPTGGYLTISADSIFPCDNSNGSVEVWIQKRMQEFSACFDCRFSEIPCYDGILGGLNGDNKVNAGDYQELSKAFGKCAGDIGFNSEADDDEDDCVSYRDYRIWYGYYTDCSK